MKNAPINYISIAEHAAIIAELTARLDSLQKELDKLKEENAALKLEIKVYKTQLFGSKSEKTLDAPFAQNDLFPEALPPALPPAKEKPEYTHRGKAKKHAPTTVLRPMVCALAVMFLLKWSASPLQNF